MLDVWHNVYSPQHTYMSSSYRSSRLGLSHWDPYVMRRGGFLELYYCNTVEWFWWDSSLISTTNWFPSVLWHCWFGHLACKNRPQNELLCVEWDVMTLWRTDGRTDRPSVRLFHSMLWLNPTHTHTPYQLTYLSDLISVQPLVLLVLELPSLSSSSICLLVAQNHKSFFSLLICSPPESTSSLNTSSPSSWPHVVSLFVIFIPIIQHSSLFIPDLKPIISINLPTIDSWYLPNCILRTSWPFYWFLC